jgi:asparagine synthase (glutamine-hydrolysing)
MCGIFGVLWHKSDEVPDRDRLVRTAELLGHRGPDGRGCFAEPGVALVHTRLSLLDLSDRSNQPFWDREKRCALVYNGEIYNFAALRAELEAEGVEFGTTSDTEVLFAALLTWGAEVALPRLEGMFAFGFYSRDEGTLLLARDRFGIKPLFICETAEAFIFASEIEAMRPWTSFKPDLLSMSSFLYGYAGPHRGHTFFADIKHADPGALIRARRGGTVSHGEFFTLTDLVDPEQQALLRSRTDAQLVDLVDEHLSATVASQLVADAPVGALCSGGLDSSLLVAMAARSHNNLAIFHADVVGPLSEVDAASRLAKHLRLDLKTVPVRDADFVARIPQVISHYGHPFYPNPHSVPFLMVSELVSANRVKAILTGEGADECYLGYPWLAPSIRMTYRARGLRASILRAVNWSVPSKDDSKYWGPTWEAPVLTGGFDRNQQALVTALHNRFEVVGEAWETRDRVWHSGRVGVSGLKSLDLLQYNLRTVLQRNDAMGMAASLEARFPYLDSEFVRLSVNMPVKAKIRFSPTYLDRRHPGFIDKWVLRQVATRYLPRELSHRPKLGFPVNANERMIIAPELFMDGPVADLFGISSKSVRFLLEQARQPLKLRLLQLNVWASIFLHNALPESVAENLTRFIQVVA